MLEDLSRVVWLGLWRFGGIGVLAVGGGGLLEDGPIEDLVVLQALSRVVWLGFWRLGKRFRGGLVFKAHKLVYHSTLGSRVITKVTAEMGGDSTPDERAGLGREQKSFM